MWSRVLPLRRAVRRSFFWGLLFGAAVLSACTGGSDSTAEQANTLEAEELDDDANLGRQVGEGQTRVVGAGQVAEGVCVDLPENTDVLSSFTEVPCTDDHDGQVAATFDLQQVGDFPGIDQVLADAETGCLARFEDFVGVAYTDSIFFLQSFTPTEESWNELDDRGVVCVILPPEGEDQLVGDLRGVAQ